MQRSLALVLAFTTHATVSLAENQALILDGAGDTVHVSNHPDLQPAQAFTIELWAYFPEIGIGRVVNKGDGIRGITDRSYDFSYKGATGNPSQRIVEVLTTYTGGAATFVTAPVTPMEWNHLAVTFDSAVGILEFYVNGVLRDSTSQTDSGPLQGKTLRQSSKPLVVGATPGFPVWDFEGKVDSLRIWSIRRTREEIQCTLNERIQTEDLTAHTGLNAVWNFDGSAHDETGVHPGTLQGNATFLPEDLPFLALCGSLIADTDTHSLSASGTQQFNLDAGPDNGGSVYFLLGSISGTTPGFTLGSVVMPLNVDIYTSLVLKNPVTGPFHDFLGVLDSQGVGHAQLIFPAGLDPALAGTTIHHAYFVSSTPGTLDFVSEPVALTLLP